MGNESINILETESPRCLKVSLYSVYKMLVKAGYKEGSCEDGLISRDFLKYHQEKDHRINQYRDFHNEVIQMLTRVTLKIKGETGREVFVVDERSMNKEVCRV